MPLCVHCGKPLVCTCKKKDQPVDQIRMQCPLKKEGALWIHVTDDLGRSIPKLNAGKSATEMVKTNKSGLAVFDPLPEKPYEATLGELTSPDFDAYERPERDKKEVPVSNGSITFVAFELKRKATLKVEVFYKRDPKRFLNLPREPFTAAALTLEGQRTAGGVPHKLNGETPGGKKDFVLVPPGTYEVTAKLPVKFDKTHELVDEKATVTLDPGGEEKIVFEVEPIYQTVQMVAHCLMTLPKYLFHDGKWMLKYNGESDDSADRTKRVALLKYALGEAQKLPVLNKDRTNLKIFLVPECFFLGKYGGYEWAAIGDLVTQLQALVKDIEWRDWLFVFGTVNGMIESGDVTEMFNLSPVIRGGHDGVEADTYTQLMQKNVYSAEMPSRAELIPETGLPRKQHVSDDVQFHGTENEVKLGKAMEKMLADTTTKDLFTKNGLTEAQWLLLKTDLDDQVKSLGMPRVIRPLRVCDLPVIRVMVDTVAVNTGKKTSVPVDTPADLKTLQFAGFAKGKLPETASYSGWEPAAVYCLKQKFPGFGKIKFKSDTATRLKALQDSKDNAEDLLREYGVDNSFQMQAFKAAILAMNDTEALDVMEKTGELVDIPSPVPFILKLLELYIAEKAIDAPSIKRLDEDFDFRDYALTIKRTVSGIIPARDVDSVPVAKRINIGVEICADHSNARLRKSLAKPRDTQDEKPVKTLSPPEIDLQLVPSCGMYPVEDAVSVRTGGYIFNCDGWLCTQNDKIENGKGQFLKVEYPGKPSTYFAVEMKLNGAAKPDVVFSQPTDVYDSFGNTHSVTVSLSKTANTGEWKYEVQFQASSLTGSALINGTMTFDSAGKLLSPLSSAPAPTLNVAGFKNGAAAMALQWKLYEGSDAKISVSAPPSAVTDKSTDGKDKPPKASTTFLIKGALSAAAAAGEVVADSVTVYDSLGTPLVLPVSFTKSATADKWDYSVSIPDAYVNVPVPPVTGALTFERGVLKTPTASNAPKIDIPGLKSGAADMKLTWKLQSNITQTVGKDEGSKVTPDGYPLKPTLTPHSAVGIKTGTGLDLSTVKASSPVTKLDDKNAEVIFGEGAGELHVYPVRDLPV